MSDLFHKDVPFDYVQRVFSTSRAEAARTSVKTKSAGRLEPTGLIYCGRPQIWMGASVENANYLERIDYLHKCGAGEFLSVEPLLGPMGSRTFGKSTG